MSDIEAVLARLEPGDYIIVIDAWVMGHQAIANLRTTSPDIRLTKIAVAGNPAECVKLYRIKDGSFNEWVKEVRDEFKDIGSAKV